MRSRHTAGYSLPEILVVMAIIGVLSLITVPQFLTYRQSSQMKAAMRSFCADVRNCRQLAVARHIQVKLEFDSANSYRFYSRNTTSDPWAVMPQELLMALRISGVSGNVKTLESPLYFDSVTCIDQDSNSKNDMYFNNDGTIQFKADGSQSSGSVTIGTTWTNVLYNRMLITVYTTGKITTTPSKV